MEMSRSAVIALVAVCGAAGASGAFLATRAVAPAAEASQVSVETQPAGLTSASPSPQFGTATTAPSAAAVATPRPAVRPRPTPVRPAPAPAVAPAVPVPLPVSAEPQATAPEVPQLSVEVPAAPHADVSPVQPVVEETFTEVTVPRNAVVGVQVENTTSSETARVEDRVVARITRDVRVDDHVVIPAGAMVYGEVTGVERGGRVREQARLMVRFHSIVLADGENLPIATDTVIRLGSSPSRESAAKIGGGAIGGAIIGGLLGGGKGAAIGGAAGAGAGTAATMAGGRNPAVLAAGTPLTVRLVEPVTVTIGR